VDAGLLKRCENTSDAKCPCNAVMKGSIMFSMQNFMPYYCDKALNSPTGAWNWIKISPFKALYDHDLGDLGYYAANGNDYINILNDNTKNILTAKSEKGFGVAGYSEKSFGVYGENKSGTNEDSNEEEEEEDSIFAEVKGKEDGTGINIFAGVKGKSNNGIGVIGESKNKVGIVGYSKNKVGIVGQTGTGKLASLFSNEELNIGVIGFSEQEGSMAVAGKTSGKEATAGHFVSEKWFGVYGETENEDDVPTAGVMGISKKNKIGVFGESSGEGEGGVGVYGESSGEGEGGVGVYGESTMGFGIYGKSEENTAGHFVSEYWFGVYGETENEDDGVSTAGVMGISKKNKIGVYGESSGEGEGGAGVYGESKSSGNIAGVGVFGKSFKGAGVFGESEKGTAGHFVSKEGHGGYFETKDPIKNALRAINNATGDGGTSATSAAIYVNSKGQGIKVFSKSNSSFESTENDGISATAKGGGGGSYYAGRFMGQGTSGGLLASVVDKENYAGTFSGKVQITGNYGTLEVSKSITATEFLYKSDKNLKKNIKTLDNSLEKILSLRGVLFEWKDDTENKKNIGLIAQEVEKILPELVNTDKKTGLKSVKYANIVAILIEGIKVHETKINSQEKRIQKLEEEIEFIKQEISKNKVEQNGPFNIIKK